MQLEAVKMNGHYFIPYLDKVELKSNKITVNINDELIQSAQKTTSTKKTIKTKSETYRKLEKLKTELKGDSLIESILDGMPIDYEYKDPGKTDRELWYDAVKEKYEL